ncbi:hypothetical protein FQZ97_1245380 [compost metagenome]
MGIACRNRGRQRCVRGIETLRGAGLPGRCGIEGRLRRGLSGFGVRDNDIGSRDGCIRGGCSIGHCFVCGASCRLQLHDLANDLQRLRAGNADGRKCAGDGGGIV